MRNEPLSLITQEMKPSTVGSLSGEDGERNLEFLEVTPNGIILPAAAIFRN